jgi:hypothetical protein
MASITEIADLIVVRLNVYAGALQADMKRFRDRHGVPAVAEALQLIEKRGRVAADPWDSVGHAGQVRVGLTRAIAEHRAQRDESGL